MSLRSRIAAWLNPSATPRVGGGSHAADSSKPEYVLLRELLTRVEKLELDRPAFVVALEEMSERCHDILDAAESKRARVAARQSKLDKRERGEAESTDGAPANREEVLAEVRRRLVSLGKLH